MPQSLSAPHVHRSGQIYRRVADGSEPRPENDRYLLDQLFRRGDELRREFAEWVDRDPEFSKSEENIPFLRLMMICDPWREETAISGSHCLASTPLTSATDRGKGSAFDCSCKKHCKKWTKRTAK
ncbi:MAG: hypothetical protein JNM03_11550 [Sphingopyxis sp.]|uniref:hypothetical protein n=1 Tax=Sphingopyxis sp. TaxID=1908224 RepID=UPI001A56265A|nr:hypothetical protein [Sphingopyxis sp.]MBL9070609.1 hypothetical protein [Sphingopyxis sp.]